MKIFARIIIFLIALVVILIYWPVIFVEAKYNFDQIAHVRYVLGTEQLGTFDKPLSPPNTDFSIIIPKIAAVASVTQDVDTSSPDFYLPVLATGVAQARGSQLPGENGNVYLFSHLNDSFWHVNTYNATFFLLDKLNPGDEIDVYFQGNLYTYQVFDKKILGPDFVDYTKDILGGNEKTLSIQTDYPPGTTFQRYIVYAKQTSVE